MLDADLAKLYGVETKQLNRAVKRNALRFPGDFMFQLTAAEVRNLRCQFGTSSSHAHGGYRWLPYAFTEHGVVMLSSVLKSQRAVAVNIEVVRVFVRLRHAVAISSDLTRRLAAVEAGLSGHKAMTGLKLAEHERRIRMVLKAIHQLMGPGEAAQTQPIGFELRR
jgi:hypothetical protein